MNRRLRKVNESFVLTIPKHLCQLYDFHVNDIFDIKPSENGSLLITRSKSPASNPRSKSPRKKRRNDIMEKESIFSDRALKAAEKVKEAAEKTVGYFTRKNSIKR